MAAPTPPGNDAQGAPAPAGPAARTGMPLKLWLRLALAWGAATGILYWISKSEWWLCALGGLGAILVIWPGPASRT